MLSVPSSAISVRAKTRAPRDSINKLTCRFRGGPWQRVRIKEGFLEEVARALLLEGEWELRVYAQWRGQKV